jgi:Ala-tRNA(Pro) deacylase
MLAGVALLSGHVLMTLTGVGFNSFACASGRLGLAPPDKTIELLGVSPGALTPLRLLNDTEFLVTPVIDAALLEADQINFHPLVRTQSAGLRPDDLLSFVRSCGREPVIVDFGPSRATQAR